MFIGREKELEILEKFYSEDNTGLAIIYGRRRIGKSTLIGEFVKGKDTIFYTASRVGKEKNIELFSKEVISFFFNEMKGIIFNSLENIFDFINSSIGDKKIVIVIDELPYWALSDESLLSIIQKYIDTVWKNKNIKLILCGSALSFMENKVLSEKSPLFGRRTCQIKLEPFNYIDSSKFVDNYSYEDKALVYGITGGVAKYLSLIDSRKTIDENIVNLFFLPNGYLYDETKNFLIQEFSDVQLVNNVIEQIAYGENSLSNIASKVHEKEPTVLYIIDKLISVGLVRKRKCILEEDNKKKTQYILKDYMFKFWYRFIPDAISSIEIGKGKIFYEKIVKHNLHLYMGSVFEDMCTYYTLTKGLSGCFNGFYSNVGTWWGTERIRNEDNKLINQATDIDIVGVDKLNKKLIVGECKYKNEKIQKDVYEKLVNRAKLLPEKFEVYEYLLFSLSGYSDYFKTVSDEKLHLFKLEDLYKI